MSQINEIFHFKILILGESNVGKSTLMTRFINETFQQTFLPTVGVDFKVRTLFIDGYQCKVQVWDTAGQERFHSITTTYYHDAAGVLLVYDVTNLNTFIRLRYWLDEINRYCSENVVKILVGNKDDLNSMNKMVNYIDARQYADRMNLNLFEVSARDNKNIYETFYKITYLALQQHLNKIQNKQETFQQTKFILTDSMKKSNKICCK